MAARNASCEVERVPEGRPAGSASGCCCADGDLEAAAPRHDLCPWPLLRRRRGELNRTFRRGLAGQGLASRNVRDKYPVRISISAPPPCCHAAAIPGPVVLHACRRPSGGRVQCIACNLHLPAMIATTTNRIVWRCGVPGHASVRSRAIHTTPIQTAGGSMEPWIGSSVRHLAARSVMPTTYLASRLLLCTFHGSI